MSDRPGGIPPEEGERPLQRPLYVEAVEENPGGSKSSGEQFDLGSWTRDMRSRVEQAIRVAGESKHAQELNTLVERIKDLAKAVEAIDEKMQSFEQKGAPYLNITPIKSHVTGVYSRVGLLNSYAEYDIESLGGEIGGKILIGLIGERLQELQEALSEIAK